MRQQKASSVVTEVINGISRAHTTAQEERALRMRYGATVPADAPLPRSAAADSELDDELLVVEMALLREMKRRQQAQQNPSKAKIVAALKSKGKAK